MSSGGVVPLPPSATRTAPQHSYPTKDHLSSPVKRVTQHFAEHKRDDVQSFGYDGDLHQLKAFGEQEFLNFLGVGEAFLDVEPPIAKVTGKQPSRKKPSGKKAGTSSGKANAETGGECSVDATKNFVQAANTLAKSMKDKRQYLLSL